jgi:hypothetical protein
VVYMCLPMCLSVHLFNFCSNWMSFLKVYTHGHSSNFWFPRVGNNNMTNMRTCKVEAIIASLFFNSHSGGWSPSWVHSARRPLNGLLYLPRVIMMMENFGGMKIGKGNRRTRRKPAPASLNLPQIPLDQTRVWTRAAAVGSQLLIAWAMAAPCSVTYFRIQKSCTVTDILEIYNVHYNVYYREVL